MIWNIILGWLLGIATAIWGLAFLFWLIAHESDKKNDAMTKDEWKVM